MKETIIYLVMRSKRKVLSGMNYVSRYVIKNQKSNLRTTIQYFSVKERDEYPNKGHLKLKLNNESDIPFKINKVSLTISAIHGGETTILSFTEGKPILRKTTGYTKNNQDKTVSPRDEGSISANFPVPEWIDDGERIRVKGVLELQRRVNYEFSSDQNINI